MQWGNKLEQKAYESEIEEKLDLTKNQASNQLDATEGTEINDNSPNQDCAKRIRQGSKRGIQV